MYELGGKVRSIKYDESGQLIPPAPVPPAPIPPTPTKRPPPSDTEVPLDGGSYRSPPAQATVPDNDVEDPIGPEPEPWWVSCWSKPVSLPAWAFAMLVFANVLGPVFYWLFKVLTQ